MDLILRPWHLTILGLASWINREQQKVIEYLQVENAVLREQVGKKRILLSDDQRRRLAVKGKELGRKGLAEISTLSRQRQYSGGIVNWSRASGTIVKGERRELVDQGFDKRLLM